MSNFSTHCDGSCQQGRMSNGCPKSQEATAAGAKLPPTSLQENQLTITNNKNLSLTKYFAPTDKLDNVTLNKILTLWLLLQAIPWN